MEEEKGNRIGKKKGIKVGKEKERKKVDRESMEGRREERRNMEKVKKE